MKNYLYIFTTVAMTVFASLVGPEAKASHTMGADLTYQCLGGNTYRITLSFYRDCIGIAAPAAPFINITSTTCNQTLGLNLYPRPGTGQEITPACSSSVTTCQGGTFTGIQEWVYDGIVTLPMQCTDWTFSYNLCCRNAAITNLSTPSTSTMYIYATLNNTVAQCNNSPVFSNRPVPFLCRGQNFAFNHGAFDADGDSIVFQLITPKQTATTNIRYLAPFTASNPLTSIPATTFNTQTGDITMTPQNLEVTVMAVLVNEYRNGVLIGSVERDIQLTVMNCSNNLPSLTGINGTNNFSMTVCANQPTCFDIFSNDPDAGQQLSVNWDAAIPGATFTSSSALHPTSTFCWTPSTSDIGNSYVFTVAVMDDACPYIGTQIYSYTIHVVGIQVNAGSDQSIACSDLATLNAIASGGTPPYQYLWSNGSTMQATTVGAGNWTVSATDGMCTGYDTVNVDMPYLPVAAFTSTIGNCGNLPIQFTDQSTTPGGVIYSWLWNFGDGGMSVSQNPTHQFPGTGSYNVSLIIENSLGCTDTISQVVVIAPPPTVAFTASNDCINAPINFNNLNPATADVWTWTFGDGSTSTAISPTHGYANSGTYTVTLTGASAGGCTSSTTQTITVYPNPSISGGSDRTICSGGSVTLTASGGSSYTWTPGGNGSTITVNPTATTNYVVQGSNANGCSNTDTVTVIINANPSINADVDQTTCEGNSVTLSATGGSSYMWNPGGLTGSSITVSPASTMSYTVTGSNSNGCTATDIVTVNVTANPTATAGPDLDICVGSSATLSASGGSSYNWSVTGGTSSTVIVTPASTTTYTVIVSNANGCTASDVVAVNVHTAPQVSLQSFFLCAGNLATLDAGVSGANYLWSPTGETSQSITISSSGTYSVTVTDAFGCSTSSTANIVSGASLTVHLSDVSFCQGDSVVLDPGYPGMLYSWSPGGQTTQTLTVSASGDYGVTVTDPNGCSGSVNIHAQMNTLPTPLFSANSACQGSTTTFNDASSAAGSAITAWGWNFGDGSTSNVQNPTHNYAAAGDYTVQLTVTTSNGCTAAYSSIVSVAPNPTANFSTADICQGGLANFSNLSAVSVGNITNYSWNFGDGNSSNDANPSHMYVNSGSMNVSLIVTTAGGCTNMHQAVIQVNPNPISSATAPSVCEGSTTRFTNASSISSGMISSYQWDFGDGTTSTLSNPVHTFSSNGNYNTTLIATSQVGCSDTTTVNVQINATPSADAGPDRFTCPRGSVTLMASGGTTYLWSPGNQTTASVSVTPNASANYIVTVTDANGCTASDVVAVTILTPPVAMASADVSICYGQSTTLTGSGGNTLSWSPGGATTSNITVNPTTTTNYILTVTDLNGCMSQDTVRVRVNSLPNVNAGPDQSICSGSTVALHATGAITYSWNPGGSSNATLVINPSSNISYVLSGTNAQGCVARDTVSIIVNQSPTVSLQPTFVCQGYSVSLDAGNNGSAFSWSTGETSQTISVSDSGNYSVVVTSQNGCSSLGATMVTVGGSLQAFPTTSTICDGQSTTLNAGNPGSTYAWSTGATTQNLTVASAGTYFVTITDQNGCSATMQHLVNVNPNPVIQFVTTDACLGTPSTFTNNSTVSSGSLQNMVWDFGNGTNSNLNNPSYTYPTPGTYNVNLSVTSTGGCSSSATGVVKVYPNPTANFSANASCLGQATGFQDGSSVNTGSITGWSWNFGDNSAIATLASPSYTYLTAGNFNTTLIITSNHGCKDTIVKNIVINGLPSPQFSVSNVCSNAAISLQNTSTSTWGSITQFEWDFGNGVTSNLATPTFTYPQSGTYSITLTATTINGCESAISRTVDIYPNPMASFTTINSCAGTPVTINNTSTVSGGNIYSNYWTFDNYGTSTTTNPTPVFNNDGSFTISLITTTTQGCRDTATNLVTIHPLPIASFSTTDACFSNTINFNNTSTVTSGTITNYTWNLSDNTTSNLTSPSHIYSIPGTYPISLNVITNNGCTAAMNSSVNIFPNPEVAFSTGNVCFGAASQFINQSSVIGGIAYTSNWTFSEGSTSVVDNPTVVFAQAGQLTATLNVTTINGCSAQVTQPFNVYNSPMARFASVDNCESLITEFTDLSTSQDGNIVAWNWNFGDGQSSTESDPSHLYGSDGQYTVSLQTTSQFGCFDTTLGRVTIFNQPAPFIQAANACAGTPVTFAASSAGNTSNINYQWNISNGTTSSDSIFTNTFVQAGTYQVELTATSDMGCIGLRALQLDIYPIPQPAFTSTEACLSSTTTFSNATSINNGSISNYSWSFGDGQNSNATNTTHMYTTPGIFQATLTATSDRGCSATTTNPATVFANPIANFSTGVQGCSPVIFTPRDLTVSTDGIVTGWLWDFGDGEVSTEQHPEHSYTVTGNYNVSLTVVSEHQCQSRISNPGFIEVFPSPVAAFEMSTSVVDDVNPSVQFSNLSQNYSSVNWIFGDGTTSTQLNPYHTFSDTGIYSAMLITVNNFGCRDTALKTIDVRPKSTLFAPNCFTPNGDGTNDVFKPEFTNMNKIQVWVFDRWGLLIDTFDGLTGSWDGTYKGNRCQTDTYVYKIKGTGIEGKDYEWVGRVSIVY